MTPAPVFVVMPFRLPHSQHMRNVIEAACMATELEGRVADEPIDPTSPLRADIVEHLNQAEVVIVDVTSTDGSANGNVAYELGVARVLGKVLVIVHPRHQTIPPPFGVHQAITFGDLSQPANREAFRNELGAFLRQAKDKLGPKVFSTIGERTAQIVADVKTLSALPDALLRRQTIWSSGFLSAFSIGPGADCFEGSEYEFRDSLLAEQEALIEAARKGCRIVCIISPPRPEAANLPLSKIAIPRTRNLLSFLDSGDPVALENIDWVVSPYWQKNFLILGNLCCYERFQKGSDRSEALTLRQTTQAAVRANHALYDVLFARLTSQALGGQPPSDLVERRMMLRRATADYLRMFLSAVEVRSGSTAASQKNPVDRKADGIEVDD